MPKKEGEVAVLEAKVDEVQEQIEGLSTEAEGLEPAQDLEQLKTQLEGLTKQLEETKKEAKAHQSNVSKKAEEVQKLQTQVSDINGVRNRLEVLTQMVADMMDRESLEVEEEKPRKRRSEEYLKRLDDKETEARQLTQTEAQFRNQAIIDDVVRQLQSVGLTVEALDTDEFIKVKLNFLENKPTEGLEEVKRIIQTKAGKPQETPEDMKARIRKEILIERGELDAETGQPAGTAGSKRIYTSAQLSDRAFYEANREDILKAQREGRIEI